LADESLSRDDDARAPWSRLRAVIYESSTIPSSFAFGAFMAAPIGIIAVGRGPELDPSVLIWFIIGFGVYLIGAILFFLSLGAFVLFAPLKVVHHTNREAYLERSQADWNALGQKRRDRLPNLDVWLAARRENWNATNLSWPFLRWPLVIAVCVSILFLVGSALSFLVALFELYLALRPESDV